MSDGASWKLALRGFKDIEDLASFSPPRKVMVENQEPEGDTGREAEIEIIPSLSRKSARKVLHLSSGAAAANRLDALVDKEDWDPRTAAEIAAATVTYNELQDEPEKDILQSYTETRIERRSFLSKTLEQHLTRRVPGPEKSWAEFDAWILDPDQEGNCVSCRLHHGPPQGGTKLVVIGDSTLRGALPKLQDVDGEGHIHWIHVSGLVIEEAFAIYLQWLGASVVPVHLLLIVGINNFLRNHSLGRMQLEFSRGLMAVEEMDDVMGRTGSSKTKVILTLESKLP